MIRNRFPESSLILSSSSHSPLLSLIEIFCSAIILLFCDPGAGDSVTLGSSPDRISCAALSSEYSRPACMLIDGWQRVLGRFSEMLEQQKTPSLKLKWWMTSRYNHQVVKKNKVRCDKHCLFESCLSAAKWNICLWLSQSEQSGSFNYNDAHPPFIRDRYNPRGILNTYLHDLRNFYQGWAEVTLLCLL